MADHRTVTEDDLARLKREREEADRRYNEALTALDAALPALPELPEPPAAPDEAQVTPLNSHWDPFQHRPAIPAGWRGRIARFVWGLVEPAFQQQKTFNAAVVDHVNRNVDAARAGPQSIAAVIGILRHQLQQQIHVQARLVMYLQQLTPYVDTKDHEFAGIARRINEDAREEIDRLDELTRALAGSLSGVSDEMLKRWESLEARYSRYGARLDELRSTISLVQQQLAALTRAAERNDRAGAGAALPPGSPRAGDAPQPAAPPSASFGGKAEDAWTYVGFENLFRGSPDEIRRRLEDYVPLFAGAADVLDAGCGRGEFLELLKARGITARGVDGNPEMVEECRRRGLDVEPGDALAYLQAQPDESIGGLIATQVVEHFEPPYLVAFLDQAHRVLRPGASLALETINVACWQAFFDSYLRDLTHARALHPDTLQYLVSAAGFIDVSIQFRVPVDPDARLQPAPPIAHHAGDAIASLAATFDGNVARINRLLFTHLDYAIIARRP